MADLLSLRSEGPVDLGGRGGRLRVGLIASPWVDVPPAAYGGTEMVVDALARGLKEAGHEVVLFATGSSSCPVERRWAHPEPLGTGLAVSAELGHVEQAYRSLAGDVDIIHDHTLLGPRLLLECPVSTPVVTTNHGPLTESMIEWLDPVSRRVPLISISQNQAASAPTVKTRAVIHHGVDTTRYGMGAGEGGYLAFLGRMNAEKGPHRAIAAARAAGLPIRLAAKMWEPAEHRFFRRAVEPLLGPGVTYEGELGGERKVEFLADAVALLNPIRWPEPFGLVMIEALACGTPVIAYPEGSAPEIITDRLNGFLCDGPASMIRAIARIPMIDRGQCRASAVERFSVGRMVADHVRLYREVIEEQLIVSAGEHGSAAAVKVMSVDAR